jgi:lactoylglutathione lyase
MKARGLRYLTAQVTDVVAEHDRLVGLGVEAPMAPTRLGDTAAIAFVRTPDGDWLELSQRADLTGPLPDI